MLAQLKEIPAHVLKKLGLENPIIAASKREVKCSGCTRKIALGSKVLMSKENENRIFCEQCAKHLVNTLHTNTRKTLV